MRGLGVAQAHGVFTTMKMGNARVCIWELLRENDDDEEGFWGRSEEEDESLEERNLGLIFVFLNFKLTFF